MQFASEGILNISRMKCNADEGLASNETSANAEKVLLQHFTVLLLLLLVADGNKLKNLLFNSLKVFTVVSNTI